MSELFDEIERTLIVRHCASDEMYDDEGSCETKIKKYGLYYWVAIADGNGENMCSECTLQTIIHQLRKGGCIPQYEDCWFKDFETIRSMRSE